jgi:hypothetical protein
VIEESPPESRSPEFGRHFFENGSPSKIVGLSRN